MKTLAPFALLICLMTTFDAFAGSADLRYQTPTAEAPRTVNRCVALLSQPGTVRASVGAIRQRLDTLIARANQVFERKERFDAVRVPHVLAMDFMRSQDDHFALRQILVGEDAIRENITGVATDAAALDQAYDPEGARRPFPRQRRTMAHVGRALMMTALAGAFYTGSVWMDQHDHRYGMVALGMAGAVTLVSYAVPPLVALFHQVVNSVILKPTFDPDLSPNFARAGRACETCGPNFSRSVLKALGEGGDLMRPISARYTVALPMSLSDAPLSYRERAAPTAAQISTALHTSGDFALPKDARQLVVTQVYYYDEIESQPVVIQTVSEPRPWAAWSK